MNMYKRYVFSFITFVEIFNEVKLMIIGTYQVQPIPSNKDVGAHFGTILHYTKHTLRAQQPTSQVTTEF